jgi:putative ABC transport system permease protein
MGRNREIAIRTALGGGRKRLVRQLLTESALLALLGGALGSIAAYGLMKWTGPNIPQDIYRVGEISVDGTALVFTLAVSFVAALLFGLAPALQTTKTNLTDTLKEGGRGGGSAKNRRLRNVLVVVEVALAMLLLAVSTLMVQSFLKLQQVDSGFNPDGVLTLEIDIPQSKYPGDTEANIFYQDVLRRARGLPATASAAEVYPLPLNFESMSKSFLIEGRAPAKPGDKLFAKNFWVTTDYFRTMEIPLFEGRDFSEQDNDQAPGVVVVNQTMADRFWPEEEPLGARIRLAPSTENERTVTVIGVVGDSKHFLMNEDPASILYLPQLQESTHRRFLAIRTRGEPLSFVDGARNAVWSVDPAIPVTTIRTMNRVVTESLGPWSGGTLVVGVLGFGAVLLAALGIYGVISFSVGQRTHEMGIRIALGAEKRSILRLILKQGLILTGTGVAIGIAGTFALSRLMQALLFGVGALDPLTFLGTPIFLTVVALAASYIPALRATGVDPISALRYE